MTGHLVLLAPPAQLVLQVPPVLRVPLDLLELLAPALAMLRLLLLILSMQKEILSIIMEAFIGHPEMVQLGHRELLPISLSSPRRVLPAQQALRGLLAQQVLPEQQARQA